MRRAALLVACAFAALGCSASDASPDIPDARSDAYVCMRADPSCTTPAPSYASIIKPILATSCVTCHYPGSNLARTSLASYSAVQLAYGAALGQVSACLMPPSNEPQLTEEDRATLLAWLACGAPDN